MNRKKTIFLLGFLAVTFLSSAQIDYSASQIAYSSLSMSQTNPVLGTARYSGMAGAMGALGGDASTMRDNPAGLGIYRSSDFTLTPNFSIANDNSVGFNINNFAIVLNLLHTNNQTGYITSSFGIGYNRLKNFKRYSDLGRDNLGHSMIDYIANGSAPANLTNDAFDLGLFDENGPWFGYNPENESKFDAISNQTRYSERGSLGEWNFSYGANISNRFYFGISAGFVSLDYRVETLYDEWVTSNFEEYWHLDNYYEASGSGFNFKFGAIAALTDFMRVGVAFHTPTFYSIDEYIKEGMDYSYADRPTDLRKAFPRSDLQTPLKLQGSLGFIVGKTAIIGLEYQFENFSAMRYSENGILDQGSKKIINEEMNITHTAKIGAEVRIVDGLSLRGGFAFVSNPSTELSKSVYTTKFQYLPLVQPQNTFYYTGGIGYKKDFFYADLAFVHQVRNETFFQYLPQEEVAPYDLTLHNSNITATLGVRF